MRLVVLADPAFASLRLLRDAGIDFTVSNEPAVLRDAEVIMMSPRYGAAALRGIAAQAKRLRWIHSLAAGVDKLPLDELRKTDIVLTNSRGVYAPALSEFVIAAMLWFAKDFALLMRNQAAHRWERYAPQRLEGKTAGIIGFGGVGRAVGRRAEGLGMRVIATRATPVDEIVGQSEYLVLCLPLTGETRGLMSAERIARMRPDSVLINVSRGAIVDEPALIDALRDHRIRGAALDVFQTEPLPPDHPLWSLDNVLISPHTADHVPDSHDRAVRFFIENFRRYERGEALDNVVDKNAGY